jgi:zinc protease
LDYPQRIQSVDAATLQVAARKYLSATAYGVVTVVPAS